jgi:hypothetical protein
MDPVPENAAKTNPVGILVRCARSFYQLLGNRRKFERVPMSGTIRLISKGYAVDNTYVCTCRDISPRGIAVDCPELLSPNLVVTIQSEQYGPSRLARVCHCQQQGDVFRIGLEFIANTDQPSS